MLYSFYKLLAKYNILKSVTMCICPKKNIKTLQMNCNEINKLIKRSVTQSYYPRKKYIKSLEKQQAINYEKLQNS